jgi:hypothetical protein
MLIGSWVMPIYQAAFGVMYALRTLDIDFAVQLAAPGGGRKADLEAVITSLGYVPVTMQSGVRKFTRQGVAIEFVSHRRGGRLQEVVKLREWNITAVPLPFINILLDFPLVVDFGYFLVRTPVPEAFFIQKLLTAQRRPGEEKKDKDLEQCSAIASRIEPRRLAMVVGGLRLSAKSWNALRASCSAIGFPPQRLAPD